MWSFSTVFWAGPSLRTESHHGTDRCGRRASDVHPSLLMCLRATVIGDLEFGGFLFDNDYLVAGVDNTEWVVRFQEEFRLRILFISLLLFRFLFWSVEEDLVAIVESFCNAEMLVLVFLIGIPRRNFISKEE